jgi:hypothetical protein
VTGVSLCFYVTTSSCVSAPPTPSASSKATCSGSGPYQCPYRVVFTFNGGHAHAAGTLSWTLTGKYYSNNASCGTPLTFTPPPQGQTIPANQPTLTLDSQGVTTSTYVVPLKTAPNPPGHTNLSYVVATAGGVSTPKQYLYQQAATTGCP